MSILSVFARWRFERVGHMLYAATVATARDPALYTRLGVPDTLDGRFDMVGLHVVLVIERLRADPPPGPALAQAVFDAMFADMDFNLREMGVGDMGVGRRNKQMWEALHGRARAYQPALDTADPAALAAALARNVWRGAPPPPGAPAALAELALRRRAALATVPLDRLARGEAPFDPKEQAA